MIREGIRTFRLGVKSLMLHKLRSSLTTMGLLFGVSSVIAMLAVGEGASYEQLEQIKAMGSTNILIRSKKPPAEEGESQSHYTPDFYGLTYNDHARILSTLAPVVREVVPVRHSDKEIRVGTKWYNGVLLGTTTTYLSVMGMQVHEGRWITHSDLKGRSNVAVLGATVAEKLFQHRDPMGRSIKTSGERFEVVGVLKKLGRRSGSIGRSVDDCIYIPIATSKDWFGEINRKTAGGREIEGVQLHEIKVQLTDQEHVLDAARVIRDMLSRHHEEDDYDITVPLELLREAEEVKRRFQLLLFFIASISLIVGGIGIMNVMLATVTERTREIGIRRALGAKRRHIIAQFLEETVVLAAFGGLLGLVIGIVGTRVAEQIWDTHPIIHWQYPALAFAISAVVGVAAGLYPAWRAANMDPVEALRHE